MPTGRFKTGELEIDFDRRLVMVEGRDVHLTQIEYKIVTLIAQHIGRVLTYDYIIQQIWGVHHTKDNQILRVNHGKHPPQVGEKPGRTALYPDGGGRRIPHGGRRKLNGMGREAAFLTKTAPVDFLPARLLSLNLNFFSSACVAG